MNGSDVVCVACGEGGATPRDELEEGAGLHSHRQGFTLGSLTHSILRLLSN